MFSNISKIPFAIALVTIIFLFGCEKANVQPQEQGAIQSYVFIYGMESSLIDTNSVLDIFIKFQSAELVNGIELYNNETLLHRFEQSQANNQDTIRHFQWRVPKDISGEQHLQAKIRTFTGVETISSVIVLYVVDGIIKTSVNSLLFDDTMLNLHSIQSVEIEWSNLSIASNIKLSTGSSPAFSLSVEEFGTYSHSLNISTNNKNKIKVYIKFNPFTHGDHTGALVVSHPQAVNKKIQLFAKGVVPVNTLYLEKKVLVAPITLPDSVSKPFSVEITSTGSSFGVNITSNQYFLLSTTENGEYRTSLTVPYSCGNSINFKLFVKFSPTAVMSYSNFINISDGYESDYIKVIGTSKLPLQQMIPVSAGTFDMGGGPYAYTIAKPLHQVTIDSFFIAKYEVMQYEWQKIMGFNYSTNKYKYNPVESVSWYETIVYCNKLSILEHRQPAYSIKGSTNPDNWGPIPEMSDSLWDAVVCDFSTNGYRLPTEAEWEYAAKGGSVSQGFLYSGSNSYNTVAWCNTSSTNTTQSVGFLNPNELNIYDMSGNINEWVWNWWYNYTEAPQSNPIGPDNGTSRIFRGGSYLIGPCEVFRRFNRNPVVRNDDLGFRLVRSK